MGGGGEFYLKFLAYILFCLALIWFPEEIGSYTGFIGVAKNQTPYNNAVAGLSGGVYGMGYIVTAPDSYFNFKRVFLINPMRPPITDV